MFFFDGISSGNIFSDISTESYISNFFGFSEEDIKRELKEIFPGDDLSKQRKQLYQFMKANFDGYIQINICLILIFHSSFWIKFIKVRSLEKKILLIKNPSNLSKQQ